MLITSSAFRIAWLCWRLTLESARFTVTPAIGNSAVRFFASTSLKKFFATSGWAGELHERGLLHDLLTVFAAELVIGAVVGEFRVFS